MPRHGVYQASTTMLALKRQGAFAGTPPAGKVFGSSLLVTWGGFLLGFVLLLAGFLVGPRVSIELQRVICVGNVDLPGPFGFALNCDSPEFMWLARDPDGLLLEKSPRQARPGYIFAGALLQAPLSLIAPAGGPPSPVGQGIYDPERITRSFQQDLPAYLAYIFLNIVLLLTSFYFLRKVLERSIIIPSTAAGVVIAVLGVLLVANDVTKAFVWSPHTQMFNILVPVLTVYLTLRAWEGALANIRFAAAWGPATGIGLTAYPVFVVIPACLLLPALIAMWQQPSAKERRRSLAGLACFFALAAAPPLLWYAYVRARTGGFYHFEFAQGELAWMAEAWAKGVGAFVREWFGIVYDLLEFAAPQSLALAAFVIWIGFWAVRGGDAVARLRPAWPSIAAGLYVSFAVLGFYTCVGWPVDRLAYPVIPALLVAAGAAAIAIAQQTGGSPRRIFVAGCLAIAVAQGVYVVVKNGPWS